MMIHTEHALLISDVRHRELVSAAVDYRRAARARRRLARAPRGGSRAGEPCEAAG